MGLSLCKTNEVYNMLCSHFSALTVTFATPSYGPKI